MRGFYLVIALLSICGGIVLAATSSQPDAEEFALLRSHNLVRSRFNAQPLNWATTLADRAQTWANRCRFEHSNGQVGPYGENIAAGTGNFTAMDAMRMFMDGLKAFDPVNPTFSDFTQIIWQSTTELGCASAQCNGIFDAAFGEAIMHVCLYNPVGNVLVTTSDFECPPIVVSFFALHFAVGI
ncbi:CAP domain-containing protein [Butyriboletus roseoflavus]|nr:CAP domain-containing protein [Butyriboletus roseoflavus]